MFMFRCQELEFPYISLTRPRGENPLFLFSFKQAVSFVDEGNFFFHRQILCLFLFYIQQKQQQQQRTPMEISQQTFWTIHSSTLFHLYCSPTLYLFY